VTRPPPGGCGMQLRAVWRLQHRRRRDGGKGGRGAEQRRRKARGQTPSRGSELTTTHNPNHTSTSISTSTSTSTSTSSGHANGLRSSYQTAPTIAAAKCAAVILTATHSLRRVCEAGRLGHAPSALKVSSLSAAGAGAGAAVATRGARMLNLLITHTCTQRHMHTCTHAHIHTYTHTHIHTYTRTDRERRGNDVCVQI